MSNGKQWYNDFRYNVHEDFWLILSYGLKYCLPRGLSYFDRDIDEELHPETLLLGLVDFAIHEMAIRPHSETEDHRKRYDEFLDKNKAFRELLAQTTDLSAFVTTIIMQRLTSGKSDAMQDLEDRLKARQRQQYLRENTFSLQVSLILENARGNGTEASMVEIFELCMMAYRTDDAMDNATDDATEAEPEMHDATYYVNVERTIRDTVFGQDKAVESFIKGFFGGELAHGQQSGPSSSFLFVGPPGVGKTLLATVAAETIGRPYRTFPMSAYAKDEDFHALIGFEYTYKKSQPGQLTSFVKENPNAILIFDEIEKAHINTVRQFLSMLEGGYMKDLYYDADVDFSNTVCIFTTNAGRDFYEDNRERKISSIPEATILDALKKDVGPNNKPTLPTELLSRLAKGYIIGFDHMEPYTLLPIIRKGINEGIELCKDRMGLKLLEVSDANIERLTHVLMFHLGDQIDARVASSRSKAMITSTIFNVLQAEAYEEQSRKMAGGFVVSQDWGNASIHLSISKDDEQVQKLFIPKPTQKKRFLVIAKNDIQQGLRPGEIDGYTLGRWYDPDDNEKRKIIDGLIQKGEVDAILVDPFFSNTGEHSRYKGTRHKKTRANALLTWLLSKDHTPPIFLLLHKGSTLDLNLEERDDFREMGVTDFVYSTRKELNQLALRLFLLKNLNQVTSKGRTLDFETDYAKSGNDYVIELHNFSLVPSMSTEAADIMVNRTENAKETSFDDVIGADSAKEELRHFIRFLKDPDSYLRTGLSISRGILLYGLPGTGKTMLARALASEADCPFIPVSGADITDRPLANSEKTRDVAGLFRLARRYAPCVLFIDEIDAFARPRSNSTPEDIAKVNKMLTEMDGFSQHKDHPVFVIAATNSNPENIDSALLRRFSKQVYVGLPSEDQRKKYLRSLKDAMKGKRYGLDHISDEDIEKLASITAGASIAQIKNALHVAQSRAVETGSELTAELLRDSYEELKFGQKVKNIEKTVQSTAYHEAGHVLMCFAAGERFWPEYATVVGRRDFLGAVIPRANKKPKMSRSDYINAIRISLGGRAAEIVCFGDEGITTGASSDLANATNQTFEMLCNYGMEDEFLLSIPPKTALSGPLATMYYQRANEILQQELNYTIDYIRNHKETLKKVGDELLRRSRLDTEELRQLVQPQ